MDGIIGWDSNLLLAVLSRGQEQARQLEARLGRGPFDAQLCRSLAQQIEFAFQTAIAIAAGASNAGVQSWPSANDSTLSESSDMAVFEDHERGEMGRKRKSVLRWTKQVRVCSGGGAEEALVDGYNWRKYGQKDILGAKYRRGYYRCTHRNSRGCLATKQVQRSDDDPSIMDVTYRGAHTCTAEAYATVRTNPQDQQPLVSLQTEHAARTDDVDSDCRILDSSPFSFPSTPASSFMGTFSPDLMSAPGTNYFTVSQCGMSSSYGGARSLEAQEKELAEMISAATSTANSVMVDMEFGHDFSFDGSSLF